MLSADQALGRLREGNRRFTSNVGTGAVFADPSRRAALVKGQEPFAIILGCSDSRVPAELVFDQGFGDLFVIRVAGNIVAPSQVGSIEFAASYFGTRLVVVAAYANAIHIWDLRSIRAQLRGMGLDWDWPEFPPGADEGEALEPVTIEVVPADWAGFTPTRRIGCSKSWPGNIASTPGFRSEAQVDREARTCTSE